MFRPRKDVPLPRPGWPTRSVLTLSTSTFAGGVVFGWFTLALAFHLLWAILLPLIIGAGFVLLLGYLARKVHKRGHHRVDVESRSFDWRP